MTKYKQLRQKYSQFIIVVLILNHCFAFKKLITFSMKTKLKENPLTIVIPLLPGVSITVS